MAGKFELNKLDKKICIIIVFGTLFFLAITGGAGVIFIIVSGASMYWYYKIRGNTANPVKMLLDQQSRPPLPRAVKILAGILVGAFTGSFMGIVAMGDGIAATIPLGMLGGYLVYIYTKKAKRD